MRAHLLVSLLVGGIAFGAFCFADASTAPTTTTTADAKRLLQRQPGCFVPNVGQWEHTARFVHRSGPVTMFVEDRGWRLDLVESAGRRAALAMTFEGGAFATGIVGEAKYRGHHDYFLGRDASRWRTDVPLYASVRYENLYPGIDVRLREKDGVPEYDLLLTPGADLSGVSVRVRGAQGLSIAPDGSLVIATALGPVTQSPPATWRLDGDGSRHDIACHFTLLGAGRYGFEVPEWAGDTPLTIDPGLIWSTVLGGSGEDVVHAIAVDAAGVVTVTGETRSRDFPAAAGPCDTGDATKVNDDVFLSRLDPRRTPEEQLEYSMFLGGSLSDGATALFVDAEGVVTLAGSTRSPDFPVCAFDYDESLSGEFDAFVTRLDPSREDHDKLLYSTYLGGKHSDIARALAVDANGVVTVTGNTMSKDFPVTSDAYDATQNGYADGFVSRLDPRETRSQQLVYSTFLGGSHVDCAMALGVDARGVVTVAGCTRSSDLPTTSGAYDRAHGGSDDVFVSRLDPRATGSAQLVYSTFCGGTDFDCAFDLALSPGGVVTLAGTTRSTSFPTTAGAYERDHTGRFADAFVCRLDPDKTGSAQFVYGTFLGGEWDDSADAVFVDAKGVITVAGWTASRDFPTTMGTYDEMTNGEDDAFVSRLDPTKIAGAQLAYSTYLGGNRDDRAAALCVDDSGVVTVTGIARSSDFPTRSGAEDTDDWHNRGGDDVFVSRLDMGVPLFGDVHAIPRRTGGTQKLTVNAGPAHAKQYVKRYYWIFGSLATEPGIDLFGVHIPLNPDLYTKVAMTRVNTTVFTNFRGVLDREGRAVASFNLPAGLPAPAGFTFYHAYVVYDAHGTFHMASNAVPLRLE